MSAAHRQHGRPWRRSTERIRDVAMALALAFLLAWLAGAETLTGAP